MLPSSRVSIFQDFSVVQTLGCGFSEHSLYTSLTFGVTLLVSEACLADPHSQKTNL